MTKLGDIYDEVLYIYYGGDIESFWFWIFKAVITVLLLYIVIGEHEVSGSWHFCDCVACIPGGKEPLIFSGQEGDWTPYLVWTVWRRKQLMPALGKEP